MRWAGMALCLLHDHIWPGRLRQTLSSLPGQTRIPTFCWCHPCFSLMDRPSLVQCFCSLVLLASLAYTFTILHAIQYSMLNHDDSTTTQNPQDHDLTHYSALSSTNNTLATPSTAGSSVGWWVHGLGSHRCGSGSKFTYLPETCTHKYLWPAYTWWVGLNW